MKRTALVWLFAGVVSTGLCAGDFNKEVERLGDNTTTSDAVEKLSKAGAEAYDDLLAGLKRKPGTDAVQAAKDSRTRLFCARLLGALGDNRAAADLLALVKEHAVENAPYPEFAGACAAALGAVWAGKEASAERTAAAEELKRLVGNDKLEHSLRWGVLQGLASLRDGAELVLPILKTEGEPLLRTAAIGVVVACGHKAAGDDLLALWTAQRGGEAAGYAKPLGMTALFGLAALADARALDGLVDVATLPEFQTYSSLRSQAVTLLKGAAFRGEAQGKLSAIILADDKPTLWVQAAITLGEFGAEGINALLAAADTPVPEGKPADHYSSRVERQFTSLTSDAALAAFVGAYDRIPAEQKDRRAKVLDQLLRYRNNLKNDGIELLGRAADDATLEAPKRAEAINAFAEARGKEALPKLTAWAKAEDAVLRAQAVQCLGRSYIPIKSAQPLLVEAMKSAGDDFAKVRQNALEGLARSDDKTLLPLFLDSLDPAKESSADVRNKALTALDNFRRPAKLKEEDLLGPIALRMADVDGNVRATALFVGTTMALRIGKKDKGVELVEKGLLDNDDRVREKAYEQAPGLGDSLKPDKVVDAALKEEKVNLKSAAVRALSMRTSFGENPRAELLVAMAGAVLNGMPGHQAHAVDLLAALTQHTGAFTQASKVLRDMIAAKSEGTIQDYSQLAQLIRALVRIKDDGMFTTIEKLAVVENVELRRACVDAYAQMGSKGDVAFLRTLRDRTDNASLQVRSQIDDAIRKLEEK